MNGLMKPQTEKMGVSQPSQMRLIDEPLSDEECPEIMRLIQPAFIN